MANLLFLHAHPDDEAIFTGGTIARLADAGHNITVVFGTGGELGLPDAQEKLDAVRRREAVIAAEILGVHNVEFLGYHDSGLDESNFPQGAFATCDLNEAAQRLAEIVERDEIDILFFDDDNGIYGHPDHKRSHEVGLLASELAAVGEAYEFTVDREQLHFLLATRHVVQDAFSSYDFTNAQLREVEKDQEASQLGKLSIEVTHHVRVNGGALRRKREAMEAHSSQIHEKVTGLDPGTFEEVYGNECFMRIRKNGNVNDPASEILHDISR